MQDPNSVDTAVGMEAEKGALVHYIKIIEATDGVDWVTQNMVIDILAEEQNHFRTFESFLKEYEAD
jgi:bacterioferritin